MTVCIAAICEHADEQAIVTACDKMVSMGGYVSGDKSVRKIDPILFDWTLMFAADDISPSTPIVNEIRALTETPTTLRGVCDAISSAYKNQRSRQIEDEVLQPIGSSWDLFRENGSAHLSQRAYESIFDRVRSYDLGIDLLVQGYDLQESKEPHIFTVSNPGTCSFYDKVGFWAIGSGQHQAIASLFATQYNRWDTLDECVAKVLVAKFAAESSVGVGKDTWVIVSRKDLPNNSLFIDPPIQRKVRREYESLPKSPQAILPEIKQTIVEQTNKLKAEINRPSAPGPTEPIK